MWRHGAWGDLLISTPLVRYLHNQGHEIVYVAGDRGPGVFKNNPHIEQLVVEPKDVVPMPELPKHMEGLQKKYNCDKIIDLSESIEVALSQHPRSPNYKLPKQERFKKYNRNFYEYTFEHTGYDWAGVDLNPELFFDDEERKLTKGLFSPEHFNIVIGMSGSGGNKAWPHTEQLCESIHKLMPNARIVTVGDERCKLIEPKGSYIINLSGQVPMRTSMMLTEIADLVISPDTGLLHAAGCFKTPKIGLLGHNTKEVITKHFINDYSVEADPLKAQCAPCFYLVYDVQLQCPTDLDSGAAYCMARGITHDKVLEQVKAVYDRRSC